jgi:hypothetical protein
LLSRLESFKKNELMVINNLDFMEQKLLFMVFVLN